MNILSYLNLKPNKIKLTDPGIFEEKDIINSKKEITTFFYKNFEKNYYFCVKNNSLIVSNSIEKLFKYFDKLELDEAMINSYRDTGLIIPPFTHIKNIYRLPIFSKITCKKLTLIDIQFLGRPSGKKIIFNDQNDFELLIKKTISKLINSNINKKIVTTISGGVDSSYLLRLISQHSSKLSIDGLCCYMDGFEKESKRAKLIAELCNVKYFLYKPKINNIKVHIKKFVNKEYDFIYDPVVPLMSEMLNYYKKINKSKIETLLFEGQGADTNLIGLPHNIAVEIYNKFFSNFFKLIGFFIPKNFENIRLRHRLLYRICKMVFILGASSWKDAFLISLGFNKEKYSSQYNYYSKKLNFLEKKFGCKHKAIMSFFQLILQVREMQKYKVLPSQFKVALPFMNLSLLNICFNTPSKFFFNLKNRKKPLMIAVNKEFPKMFEKNKTTPFIVKYDKKSVRNSGFLLDSDIRNLNIVTMRNKINNWK